MDAIYEKLFVRDQMRYRKLAIETMVACFLVAASFFVVNAALGYLVERGMQITPMIHNVVILASVWGPAFLMFPRIRSEAEALKKNNKEASGQSLEK